MALSTQRAVSDGTLVYLDLSIEYMKRADITVFMNDLPADPDSWVWVGATDKRIKFTPAVPDGVEVLIKRTTKIKEVQHKFELGAKFNNRTMDDNFLQLLYLNQEAVEGAALTDIFNDVDFHGYRIRNLGPAQNDNEGITLGQVKEMTPGPWQAKVQAEAARDKAKEWATKSTAVEGTLQSAKTYAERAKVSEDKSVAAATSIDGKVDAAAASAAAAAASQGQSAASALESKNWATASAASAQESQGWANAAATFDPAKFVPQTSATGYATLPTSSGTAGGPAGFRYNDSKQRVEFYDGVKWAVLGGGGDLFEYRWHNGPRSSIANGFAATDGQAVTYITHPDVCQAVWDGKQVSTTEAEWQADPTQRNKWSRGDGASWVRLPDLNGALTTTGKPFYLRGGPENVNGTWAGDAIRNITGTFGTNGLVGSNGVSGAFAIDKPVKSFNNGSSDYFTIKFDTSRIVPTADENRVKTAYGVYVVRVFTEVDNPGALDAAGLATQLGLVDARVQAIEANLSNKGADELWTGSAGAPGVVTLSREVLTGEFIVLKHNAVSSLTAPQVYLPAIAHQAGGGAYMNFSSGGATTGLAIIKPTTPGGPSTLNFMGLTSGYGVIGVYALRP